MTNKKLGRQPLCQKLGSFVGEVVVPQVQRIELREQGQCWRQTANLLCGPIAAREPRCEREHLGSHRHLGAQTRDPTIFTPTCLCVHLPRPWFQCHNRACVLMQSRHWTRDSLVCRRQMEDNAVEYGCAGLRIIAVMPILLARLMTPPTLCEPTAFPTSGSPETHVTSPPRSLVHGQCFAFSKHLSTRFGRDVFLLRLPVGSGKNRGRATRKTRSESTTLVFSAVLRPPSLTSSIERSEIAQCKKAHCACEWPCEEEKTNT